MSRDRDWERQRHNLIRSMFRQQSDLSPVPEEQTSSSAPQAPSEDDESLPELIIERVPRNVDYEQTNEFIEHFTKKMIKHYKKKILKEDVHSDASVSSVDEALILGPNIQPDVDIQEHEADVEDFTAEDGEPVNSPIGSENATVVLRSDNGERHLTSHSSFDELSTEHKIFKDVVSDASVSSVDEASKQPDEEIQEHEPDIETNATGTAMDEDGEQVQSLMGSENENQSTEALRTDNDERHLTSHSSFDELSPEHKIPRDVDSDASVSSVDEASIQPDNEIQEHEADVETNATATAMDEDGEPVQPPIGSEKEILPIVVQRSDNDERHLTSHSSFDELSPEPRIEQIEGDHVSPLGSVDSEACENGVLGRPAASSTPSREMLYEGEPGQEERIRDFSEKSAEIEGTEGDDTAAKRQSDPEAGSTDSSEDEDSNMEVMRRQATTHEDTDIYVQEFGSPNNSLIKDRTSRLLTTENISSESKHAEDTIINAEPSPNREIEASTDASQASNNDNDSLAESLIYPVSRKRRRDEIEGYWERFHTKMMGHYKRMFQKEDVGSSFPQPIRDPQPIKGEEQRQDVAENQEDDIENGQGHIHGKDGKDESNVQPDEGIEEREHSESAGIVPAPVSGNARRRGRAVRARGRARRRDGTRRTYAGRTAAGPPQLSRNFEERRLEVLQGMLAALHRICQVLDERLQRQ